MYDPVILQDYITSYYKTLLGTYDTGILSLRSDIWNDSDKLTLSQQGMLENKFTLDEIKITLFSCNPSKAPGPDDISFYSTKHIGT